MIRLSPAQEKSLGIAGPTSPGKSRAREPKTRKPVKPAVPPRKILFLDPSSTSIGWAIFEGFQLERVGVLRASSRDQDRRTDQLASQVLDLARESGSGLIVAEVASGLHRRAAATRGNQAATAICALSQGVYVGTLRAAGFVVGRVQERTWTKGRTKQARANTVYLTEPVYRRFVDQGQDKGLDAADAVGLGRWFLAQLNGR